MKLNKSLKMLKEVTTEVLSSRQKTYGHPLPVFEAIALEWSTLFGVDIRPRDVAFAMVKMKIVRYNFGQDADSLKDIIGYTALINELEETTDVKNSKTKKT